MQGHVIATMEYKMKNELKCCPQLPFSLVKGIKGVSKKKLRGTRKVKEIRRGKELSEKG